MAVSGVVCRVVAVAIVVGYIAVAPMRAQQTVAPQYVPGEVIVQFKASVDEAQRAAIRSAHGATRLRGYNVLRTERLALPATANPIAAAQAFSAHPEVEAAQPNFIRQAVSLASPNDTYYGSLWGLQQINAPGAWAAFGAGSDTVVVADIDTGVDYTHPDLAPNMWRNPGEVPGNGVDDDGNGYVDDVYGIDAANNDSDPADDHWHGTHTSGTFGAVSDNAYGVTGVTSKVRILACKFLTAAGSGTDADAIECFNYVVAMKQRGVNIRVTSNSWGEQRGTYFPLPLQNAIDAAGNAGIVNVFAAGNDGVNIDVTPFDPASFTSSSIVSVAASDNGDGRASWSNYGATSVDLAAPGVDILSTYPGGFAWASGTSMATPHVAGVAALLLAHRPWLSVAEVKDSLLAGADRLNQWNGLVVSGGRLNAYQTLNAGATNSSPSVALTSPSAGQSFTVPAVINVAATAADNDGSVTGVDFYVDGTLIGGDTAAPFAITWDATAGSHTFTAVAVDDDGATTTSAPVTVSVQSAPVNAAPTVSITSPADGSTVVAGATVTVMASAADADGIARVEFFVGSTLIGTDSSPGDGYSAPWRPTTQGVYSVTARAFDTKGNATTSAPVRVRVKRK
jgi:serine protease